VLEGSEQRHPARSPARWTMASYQADRGADKQESRKCRDHDTDNTDGTNQEE
jgi:hypothetical protein